MTLTRRKAMALIGGGTVLAAGTGAAAFVATRTPYEALAPWSAAGGYGDRRLDALSYALLAPNPHNRQPWIAGLEGADGVVLYRDPELDLPQTDPHDRQLTIGMGCFIELLALAAAEGGAALDIDLFPEGEGAGAPVARIGWRTGGRPDPLFAHVLDRRSCKEPFDMTRPVAPDALATLAAAMPDGVTLAGSTDADQVATLRALCWEAWQIEAATERTWAESVDLLRIGKAEIEAEPDGIDLGDPLLEVLRRLGMLDREALMDTSSAGFRGTSESYRALFEATPAFVWLITTGNARLDQIAAGRAWLRLNLATTAMGLALHPVSQALQEFPEMAGPYDRVHDMLAAPGQTVQMLGRLGHGPTTPRTPRWPLEAKLRNA